MADDSTADDRRVRHYFGASLGKAELGIYALLSVLLGLGPDFEDTP